MKEKIASIARHILTGAAAWVVDNGWLSAADTDEAVRIIGALVSIILTRLVIWLLEKMDWAKFFKSLGDSSNGASNLFMIGVMSAAVGLGFSLPSCSPTHYEVNTLPYAEQIKSRPDAVLMKPEDVTPIGQSFQPDINARIKTDQGEFVVGSGGVSGDVVIDLSSGK